MANTISPLRLVGIGGLGLMLSPAAGHLSDALTPTARFIRMHDRGQRDERRDSARLAWQHHGAELVSDYDSLIADGEIDGVVICAGKNGDDSDILRTLLPRLARCTGRPFVLHLSTVSPRFVEAAHSAAKHHGIRYANYPVTGGPAGATNANMLILASGDQALYQLLEPLLQALGQPNYLGSSPTRGAEIKLINHYLVFSGLAGITTAAALTAATLNEPVESPAVVETLAFLSGGAGHTRQWELSLQKGLEQGLWNQGFMLDHATIDALYALQLGVEKGLPIGVLRPLADLILQFAYLLHEQPQERLATQAVIRIIQPDRQSQLNQFFRQHDRANADGAELLRSRLAALPEELRSRVGLDISNKSLIDTRQS